MPSKNPEVPETAPKPRCVRRLNFDSDEPVPAPAPAPPQGDLNNHLENLLAEERLRARDTWNFDFDNDVPLVGRWQWERVLVPVQPAPQLGQHEEEQQQPEDDEEGAVLPQPEH